MTRIKTVLAVLLAAAALPAFADYPNQNTQNNTGNDTSTTSSTTTNTNTSSNGNMAGMTGNDKQAMDTALSKGACSTDIQAFCNDITPGAGRVASCLKSHEDKVSTQCQTQMKTAMNDFHAMRKTCRADVAKYCKGSEPGAGNVVSCLKSHEDQLSSACRSDTLNLTG